MFQFVVRDNEYDLFASSFALFQRISTIHIEKSATCFILKSITGLA